MEIYVSVGINTDDTVEFRTNAAITNVVVFINQLQQKMFTILAVGIGLIPFIQVWKSMETMIRISPQFLNFGRKNLLHLKYIFLNCVWLSSRYHFHVKKMNDPIR